MLVTADRFIMQIGWIFVLCFTFPRYSVATSKCYDLNVNFKETNCRGFPKSNLEEIKDKHQTKEFAYSQLIFYRAIVYKAPARNMGKALIARGAGWQDIQDVTRPAGHAVAKPLEHVIMAHNTNKFIAYNNIPPDIPKVKTKSNSKGVLMMNPEAQDEASWIVHTIPGFPKALTGYVFPPAEIQKGHLFICLTIKESEIDAIATALRIATPLIYHNDIPDDPARPNLKKLVNGESRLTLPLTVAQQISTAAAQGLKVTIYSKGEKSKYEVYRRVLVKKLKTGIKVWTTRDKTLKSDCRILDKSIKLVTSPITIGDHASSLENDVSQWLISETGNKFCVIDKPYHKSQTKEPAMAVCIDDATIFGHFNVIGQNVENCKYISMCYCALPSNRNHILIIQNNLIIYILLLYQNMAVRQLIADLGHCETDTRRIASHNMHLWCVFILFISLPKPSTTTSKCQNLAGGAEADWAIMYKAPGQNMGKAFTQGNAGAWQNTAVLNVIGGHSFGKALEHVIAVEPTNKFIAYNNVPPDIPKPKTKSNSKGVLMMNPQDADAAAWIVHTVPGFPKALRGYLFPPEEIQKGHLFICLTIKETMTMRIATPLIYHNDIPDSEIDSRPNLKKLVNVTRQISTANAAGLKVTIYSKRKKLKYGKSHVLLRNFQNKHRAEFCSVKIYRRVLVKKLKTGIKVWTTRDKILKSDCRILNRNIKLVTSPITIGDHASSLESDVSQWLISDPGNKFCAVDKPYHKSQAKEPAIAVCIDDATIFAPGQNMGKAFTQGNAGAWQNTAVLNVIGGHSFGKALEHVIAVEPTNKFIAYNNVPPDIPKPKTKSNSKGVLMMNPQDADAAAWIVHTVPGFPKALRGYLFPPEEIQKGHLFICLTIKESEIDAIAMTMRIATPLIYHNDIPDSEIDSRPNLKKLVNGESRFIPPLTVTRDISTAAPGGLKVTIYSKGEKSRFEIYRRILVRKLKTTIKIWTTRDKTLKSDCRIFGRNIRLVTSPISVSGHPSSLESDVSQWLISEQGNKFCAVDKPYQKSQTKEPAMAVCIDDASIFTRFNEIAANLDNCT
ncbi:Plancitoxin-1 [Trichinella nativa]|uniref:Plancitoxin-1 n=1 Tax=Trichinella nativa TaxID=6335 RepID=A0A0V1KR63_9BILA|nr:Plancitoxin-1 [Trichinella nativa]